MNSFSNECCPNFWSLLDCQPILQWCRTFASKLDLKNSWWNLNSWEILFHECRRIHRRSHEHSPYHWMLFTWLCNVRHSILSVSHLVFDFVHKFCCVTAHDKRFRICLFLIINTIKLLQSIMINLSVPYGMRISVEKRFFTMRDNLLHRIPRSFIRFPWSIVRRSSTFFHSWEDQDRP